MTDQDREAQERSAATIRQQKRLERRAAVLVDGPIGPSGRQTRRKHRRERIKDWIIAVLLGLDIFLASILFGTHSQTISRQAGLAAREDRWWGQVTCSLLNFVDPNHCEDAIK